MAVDKSADPINDILQKCRQKMLDSEEFQNYQDKMSAGVKNSTHNKLQKYYQNMEDSEEFMLTITKNSNERMEQGKLWAKTRKKLNKAEHIKMATKKRG